MVGNEGGDGQASIGAVPDEHDGAGASGGGAARLPEPTVRTRRRGWLVASGLLAVAGVVAGAVVLLSRAGGDEPDGDARGDRPDTTTSSAPEAVTPQRAFARAALLLDEAGSFTYRGTVHAAGPSIVRPGPWLSADVTVEGEVSLPDRTHEVAVDGAGRAAETVTSGLTVWARTANDQAGLAAQPYEVVAEFDSADARIESGAARAGIWLELTTDRRDGGTDAAGRRTFRAAVPTSAVSGNGTRSSGRAELVLTVDEQGLPVRIEIMQADGGALGLAFDLAGVGEPVAIPVPGGDEPTSVTGPVTVDDVVAAGIADPVELGRVPPGWSLYSMELADDSPRAGCSVLKLQYQHADAVGVEWLIDLDVMSAACADDHETYPEPFSAGDFSGTVEAGRDGSIGLVSDGRTGVAFFTDMPTADTVTLLESLTPFDPATPPEPTAAVDARP